MLWLERALRRGVIPFSCGGASVCFALYGLCVHMAALEWQQIGTSTPLQQQSQQHLPRYRKRDCREHAEQLEQHAATAAALAVISAATTREAWQDWRLYKSLKSLERMEEFLLQRSPPFCVRVSVLVATVVSFVVAEQATGRIRLWQPARPCIFRMDD